MGARVTAATFDYRGAREAVFGSSIPGALKLLLLALIEWMPQCEPSVMTLAAQCGVERKTVLRALVRLERMAVLRVERASGRRSRYVLRPAEDWKPGPSPVPTEGTGTPEPPVPISRTGTSAPPVPTATGTGTNGGTVPVPTEPQTGPILVPEAGRSRSESGSEAAHARALEAAGFPRRSPAPAPISRATTVPSEHPTESYLGACVMAGVSPQQARATWNHYWTAGLPPGGVEKLEPWLVKQAKEKQNAAPAQRAGPGRSEPAPDPVEFDPRYIDSHHRDFCGRHGLNPERLAREWRKLAKASGKTFTRAEADRAFAEFIRQRVREKGQGP